MILITIVVCCPLQTALWRPARTARARHERAYGVTRLARDPGQVQHRRPPKWRVVSERSASARGRRRTVQFLRQVQVCQSGRFLVGRLAGHSRAGGGDPTPPVRSHAQLEVVLVHRSWTAPTHDSSAP